jgi:hypothetical protein
LLKCYIDRIGGGSGFVMLLTSPSGFIRLDPLPNLPDAAELPRQISLKRFLFEVVQWSGGTARCLEHVGSHQPTQRKTVQCRRFELLASLDIHLDKLTVQVLSGDLCEGNRQDALRLNPTF